MKNRIEKENTTKLIKITIELFPEEHAELKRMSDILGSTVKQTVEALLSGQAEDYLKREGDEIWDSLVEFLTQSYGDTPRRQLLRRYLLAWEVNSRLPSVAERRVLSRGPLLSLENYRKYLAELGADEQETDVWERVAA